MVTLLNHSNSTKSFTPIKSLNTYNYKESFPFESENSLVNRFIELTNTKKIKPRSRSKLGFVSELETGYGVADIVIFKLRNNWKDYDQISNFNPRWTNILVSLPYRKIFNLEDFIKISHCSNKTAINILNAFRSAGYCDKTKSGWIKLKQPRPPINTIFSIEAKIKDWKRALYQASRYKEFSNQSWVLLDHHYSRPAISNIEEFEKRNIGLITIDVDKKVNLIIESKKSNPSNDYRYWYACTKILTSIISK